VTIYLFKYSTFEAFIETIRARPGLLFGRSPLTGLWCMLIAYETAVQEHAVQESEQFNCQILEEFDSWLRQQLGMGNACGWYLFIINETQSEKEAWNRFIELWDKYYSDRLNNFKTPLIE
jgi:hypothetical protein